MTLMWRYSSLIDTQAAWRKRAALAAQVDEGGRWGLAMRLPKTDEVSLPHADVAPTRDEAGEEMQ